MTNPGIGDSELLFMNTCTWGSVATSSYTTLPRGLDFGEDSPFSYGTEEVSRGQFALLDTVT